MNLLEHYIEEIYEENEVKYDLEFGDYIILIEAKALVNCYGWREITNISMAIDKWITAKEKGYYLA